MNTPAQKPAFSLYIHIPYCLQKCPYCDFNSYGVADGSREKDEDAYVKAIISELTHYSKEEAWRGRSLASIFFGGGTPSLFSQDSIGKILEAVSSTFSQAPNAEISLEANPGSVYEELGREKLGDFRKLGINRISMGVQSFNDAKLKFLGRIHSAKDTYAAVSNLRQAGFDNFNLDLMFGTSTEEISSWKEDLKIAVSLSPKHIASYGLTIEPGTEFSNRQRRGLVLLSDEEVCAEMYEYTQDFLNSSGYQQYEISNFSIAGFECQHNTGYWNGRDYLGLGAGAHSYLAASKENDFGSRWSNIPGPELYITRAARNGDASQRRESIDRDRAELEFFLTGLRTSTGISLTEHSLKFGTQNRIAFQDALERLEAERLIERSAQELKLTKKGYLFSDYVFESIAAA